LLADRRACSEVARLANGTICRFTCAPVAASNFAMASLVACSSGPSVKYTYVSVWPLKLLKSTLEGAVAASDEGDDGEPGAQADRLIAAITAQTAGIWVRSFMGSTSLGNLQKARTGASTGMA